MRKTIEIRGARENNLKNIDVEIPRDQLVVFTGVSGSGKSSLAFDVIYGEGQRRFLESLSAFSRRYTPQQQKADVDFVFGLSPVVAIDQRTGIRNPRSTIGTMTDIYDYLRLLFCTIGIAHCPYCEHEFTIKTVNQLTEHILSLATGTVVEIRVPVNKIYGEDYDFLFDELRTMGYRRMVIDGELVDTSDPVELDEEHVYSIEAIIDRFNIRDDDMYKQVQLAVENACRVGQGFLRTEIVEGAVPNGFYDNMGCPEHHIVMGELEPYYFSFNDPDSACRTCRGLGSYLKAVPRLIVERPDKSIRKGAIANVVINCTHADRYALIYSMAQHFDFSLDAPFQDLPAEIQDLILYGTGGEKFELVEPPDWDGRRPRNLGNLLAYEGAINRVDRWYKYYRDRTGHEGFYEYLRNRLMAERVCPDCGGQKLKPQRLLVSIHDRNIHELSNMSLSDLKAFLENINIPENKLIAGNAILSEMLSRLTILIDIGVGYLSLGRQVRTISGGELQRVRLSTQIGSGLMGMMYVLDEPSIGLHPKDGYKLINTLKRLRDNGNTVIVIEHDPETIRQADHIVEMGPGPGIHGGRVVVQGTLEDIMLSPVSITGSYLSGREYIPVPEARRAPNGHTLTIVGAHQNNLKDITIDIPLGLFICVTGVSGSGKSSLINDVLYQTLRSLNDPRVLAGAVDEIVGVEHIDTVINIDQSPIGRSSRSNPVTYIGIFDRIRKLFAETPMAEALGYSYRDFSFNTNQGGRCEECSGNGFITTELQFMPDVQTVCPICKGKRFKQDVLEITYNEKNIADVLDMSFEEAAEFFADNRYLTRKIEVMLDLGLGYLKLGQPSPHLSGGEAQRVKLATELGKIKRGTHKLYILDEPTTGLHLADIQKLLDCLNALVDAGHTVLVIEHQLDVIKTADYIIDLGPDGGDEGGYVVARGTPEEIVQVQESYTGQYLKAAISSTLIHP